MRALCLAVAAILCAGMARSAEPAPETPVKPAPAASEVIKIYSVADLLAQGETILTAEVGESTPDGTQLKVLQMLKGPPDELLGQMNAADRQKRADELLKREADAREAAVKNPKNTPAIGDDPVAALPKIAVLRAEKVPLPEKGTQWLFILWDRAAPTKDFPIRYKTGHPQCVYDVALAPEVKLVLSRRRPEDSRRYLREWDQEMAKRLDQRKDDEALKTMPAGNLESGLTLKVLRPRASVRGDNSFDATARFENSRSYDQAFYDGLLSGFGARLRRKGDPVEKTIVIRATNKSLTGPVDQATLGLVDEGDFSTIATKATYSKELHFDAKDHPELNGLDGEYVISIFYISTQTGKGLENLQAAPWTGTLMSNDEAITFKPRTAAAPSIPPKRP